MSAYEILCDSNKEPERWLELRRKHVGASETPAILGIEGHWGSRHAIAAEKLGVQDDRPTTEPQEAGKVLEQPIAEWCVQDIAKEYGTELYCSMFGKLIRSKAFPWMGCTPDAVVHSDPVAYNLGVMDPPLQVKNSIFDWKEEIPPHVLVQVLHELIVLDAPVGYACCLMMGNRLRWGSVVRADHEELCSQIIYETSVFWWKLQHGERIEPDASKSCTEALNRLWPAKKDRTIALPGDFVELDDMREKCLASARSAQTDADTISNEIREAMKDAEIATLPNGVEFHYRQGKRSRPLLRKPAKE
jgi:predicted phage-related endonuclease